MKQKNQLVWTSESHRRYLRLQFMTIRWIIMKRSPALIRCNGHWPITYTEEQYMYCNFVKINSLNCPWNLCFHFFIKNMSHRHHTSRSFRFRLNNRHMPISLDAPNVDIILYIFLVESNKMLGTNDVCRRFNFVKMFNREKTNILELLTNLDRIRKKYVWQQKETILV